MADLYTFFIIYKVDDFPSLEISSFRSRGKDEKKQLDTTHKWSGQRSPKLGAASWNRMMA